MNPIDDSGKVHLINIESPKNSSSTLESRISKVTKFPEERKESELKANKKIFAKLKQELLETATLQRPLGKVAKCFSETFGRTGKTVPLKSITTTQNPVTKISPQLFPKKVVKSSLELYFKKDLNEKIEEIEIVFDNAIISFNKYESDKAISSDQLKELVGETLKIKNKLLKQLKENPEFNIEDEAKEILKIANENPANVKSFLSDIGNTLAIKFSRKEVLSKIEMIEIWLNEANVLYSKEDLVGQLRLHFEDNADLPKLIRDLNSDKRQYLTKEEFLKVIGKDLKSFEESSFFKNLPEFVSELELRVLSKTPLTEKFLDHLKKDLSSTQNPQFAVKTGPESIREQLAAKFAKVIGLKQTLLPKTERELHGAQFIENKEASEAPKVLASEWVEEDLLNYELWNKYLAVKKELAVAKFNADHEGVKKLSETFAQLRKEIMTLGKNEKEESEFLLRYRTSIQEDVLWDLLTASADSHFRQYKLQPDGRCVNIDFSRWGALSEIGKNEDNKLFCLIRSAMLDHPAMELPLSQQTIDLIRSWDLNAIQKQARAENLIGKPSDYNFEVWVDFQQNQDLLKKMQVMDNELIEKNRKVAEEIASWLKVNHQGKETRPLIKTLLEKIDVLKANMEKQWFKSIAPQSFKQIMLRMQRAQKYIQETQNPTIIGLRDAVYPNLAIFYRVAERMFENPGGEIAYLEAGAGFRSLNDIIEASQTGLANKEEVEAMKKAIAEIHQMKIAYPSEMQSMFWVSF